MTLSNLAAVLNVLILLQTTAYSLSTGNKQERTRENDIALTEANSGLSSDLNTPLDIAQLQTELASLSIHSYFKELYINLTSHVESSSSTKASAIYSYKSQVNYGNCGYYRFDVHKHETEDREQIVQAELRLLQIKSPTLDGYYTVDIYYLINETHWSPIPISYDHIDSTHGWKTFDITPIINNWKQGLVNHHGIQLKFTDKAKETLPCEGVFSTGEDNHDPVNSEPLLIVYANDYSKPQKSLRKRDIITDEIVGDILSCCRRKKLVVPLSDLFPYVVIPKLVDIGICEGQCTSASLGNPSYYSKILDRYYHSTEGSAIPEKCCVPASFRSLTMLVYSPTSKSFSTKSLPIMVTSCTCF